MPRSIVIESPQSLVNDANHSSPEAAVKGFFGSALLGDGPGACGYLLPDEQGICNNTYAQSSQGGSLWATTGAIGVGNAVMSGSLALVPIRGKLCTSGSCQSFVGDGLPVGTSFQNAFQQAMNQNSNSNLAPCERIGGAWYVDFPGL